MEYGRTIIEKCLEASGQQYSINEGDGAFYGKIDFEVLDALQDVSFNVRLST